MLYQAVVILLPAIKEIVADRQKLAVERMENMAKATVPGLSTLGITLSYGVETVKGQKPTKFTVLERCNDIPEITLETETIDASALEDMQSRYVAGRQDTGGEWAPVFNLTEEVIGQLDTMMKASDTGIKTGLRTWFQVIVPNLTKAFFVVGQPGTKVPLPAMAQNELLTGSISISIDEYVGLDTKVEPTESESL